jgi:hypothetical protein
LIPKKLGQGDVVSRAMPHNEGMNTARIDKLLALARQRIQLGASVSAESAYLDALLLIRLHHLSAADFGGQVEEIAQLIKNPAQIA